jgi:hypothetical protein
MKTKPFKQNQLVAHTGNEEYVNANEKPKNPTSEVLNSEPKPIDDSITDNLSSPFDLFENVTVGSNSIEDGNTGVTNINLPHPATSSES